jgi:hypothetical protein
MDAFEVNDTPNICRADRVRRRSKGADTVAKVENLQAIIFPPKGNPTGDR